jgi:hypothetical protein
VATAGDVNGDGFSDVIVGADTFSNGENSEGRAFVYHGSAAGLATTPAWTAEPNQAFTHFGSVGTAGDVNGDGFSDVIVGALGYDNGQLDEGRAFVYLGSAAGLSTSVAWTAESDQASGQLGWTVGTAGDTNGDGFSDVVVGAVGYDNDQADEGRVYLYRGSAAGLSPTPAWTAESNQFLCGFGFAVGTAGDVNGDGYADVIVGADSYDNGQTNEGRAFIYLGSADGAPSAPLTVESNAGGFLLGVGAATAGDVNGDGFSDIIVGVGGYDNGQTDEGAAFVYLGSALPLATAAVWTTEGDVGGAEYGYAVATAGDVNGDGYSDVIVGAWRYASVGRAFVYHGSAAGLALTPAWSVQSDQISRFGAAVGTAGDVNGDGYSDVIVGAFIYSNGQTNEGRAFVYHGSPAGLATTPAWTAESDQADAEFGASVATAGDVNGDGFSDVIVGSHFYDNDQSTEGRAYVYHGSATGLSTTAAWIAEGNQASAFFGFPVATAGDVNGDGFSDVIVGAYRFDNGQTDEGRAYVYHGSAAGLATIPAWTVESNQVDSRFGHAVATAGDVNGDGYSDVMVGSEFYANGESTEGRAFVYHGSASGLSTTAAWTAEPNQAGAHFGVSVATLGDVNGDGFSDVIVGAEDFDNGQTSEGGAFAYLGSAAGLSTSPSWTAESNLASAQMGHSVASAGDVNGDGFADAIVGSHTYNLLQGTPGRAFVYYGNGGPGRLTLPRQQRTNGSTPVVLLGRSDSPTQFRIRAHLLSIYGRTRLRLEHEVKPLGTPFNGLGTVTGGFADIGNDGVVEIDQLVSALSPNTLYHWRVRAKYDPVKTPFQRSGPWVHIPAKGWNESYLRTGEATTGIEVAAAAPASLLIEAPRPNPVRTTAAFGYTLPEKARVELAIYDATGRARSVLADAVQSAGRHVVSWDGRDARGARLPAGVYFVRLSFGQRVETQKFVLAR